MPNQIPNDSSRTSIRSDPWRLSVLVTEDNVALRQLMADVLQHEGYRVTQAGNSVEMQRAILQSGLGRQADDPFDLIVSDVFMPGRSGLDALSELRKTGLRSRFLFVTSFPDAVTYERIENLDVQLLAKPFSLKEFRAVAATMLQTQMPNSESTSCRQ